MNEIQVGLWLLAIVVFTLVAPQATAQSGSEGWRFSIAPYLWAAGMDGTMKIAHLEEDVDVPFDTIIDNLDFALMGHFDMRNERWVLSSDLVFVDLEHGEDMDDATVTAGLDMTLLEFAGGYRVSPAVALLVGARWVDMGASLRYSGQIVDEEADAGKSWIDPLVGVHVFAPLSDRWWLGLRGDVGGFGVGSDLTWQAYAISASGPRSWCRSSSATTLSTWTTRTAAEFTISASICWSPGRSSAWFSAF